MFQYYVSAVWLATICFIILKARKRIARVDVRHSATVYSHFAACRSDSEGTQKEVILCKSIPSPTETLRVKMPFIYKRKKQIIIPGSWKATRRVLLICLSSPVSIVIWHLALNGLEFACRRVDESLDAVRPYPLPLVYRSNNTNPLVTTQDDVLGGGWWCAVRYWLHRSTANWYRTWDTTCVTKQYSTHFKIWTV
jgi:hypothetical protein